MHSRTLFLFLKFAEKDRKKFRNLAASACFLPKGTQTLPEQGKQAQNYWYFCRNQSEK